MEIIWKLKQVAIGLFGENVRHLEFNLDHKLANMDEKFRDEVVLQEVIKFNKNISNDKQNTNNDNLKLNVPDNNTKKNSDDVNKSLLNNNNNNNHKHKQHRLKLVHQFLIHPNRTIMNNKNWNSKDNVKNINANTKDGNRNMKNWLKNEDVWNWNEPHNKVLSKDNILDLLLLHHLQLLDPKSNSTQLCQLP